MKKPGAVLLALLAVLVAPALAAVAQPPPILRYAIEYNSTSMTPGHGGLTSLYVRGVLVAYLVEAKPPIYTYQYRVVASSVKLSGFPGNDTEAKTEIIEALSQPRNITIDAARCRVVGGGGKLDLPPYCSPEALTSLHLPNATVSRRDGRIVVDARMENAEIHAVYSKDGLLIEAVLRTQMPGEQEVLRLTLLGVEQPSATTRYTRAAIMAVIAAATAGIATWVALRRRRA